MSKYHEQRCDNCGEEIRLDYNPEDEDGNWECVACKEARAKGDGK